MSHLLPVLLAIAGYLLLLAPLVVLHELGHYFAGRLVGVRAEAFSVGFGRELLGRTDKRGTRWKLSAWPLGGYVRFAGDANAASMPDNELAGASAEALKGTHPGAPLWAKALIAAAGPLANFLVAIVIFAGFNLWFGVASTPPVIGSFAPHSAAQAAGLQVGDRIVAIDGDAIAGFGDIVEHVMLYPGRTVSVAYARGGQTVVKDVTLARVTESDGTGGQATRGLLGIASGRSVLARVGPITAVRVAIGQCGELVRMSVIGLKQVITGERSTKELGGPIKIARTSGQVMALGWLPFAEFAAFVSINLGFINLLPIPMLDGGHLVIYAAEAIRRRPLGERSLEWAYRSGLALVLALVVFVTFNDLIGLLPHSN